MTTPAELFDIIRRQFDPVNPSGFLGVVSDIGSAVAQTTRDVGAGLIASARQHAETTLSNGRQIAVTMETWNAVGKALAHELDRDDPASLRSLIASLVVARQPATASPSAETEIIAAASALVGRHSRVNILIISNHRQPVEYARVTWARPRSVLIGQVIQWHVVLLDQDVYPGHSDIAPWIAAEVQPRLSSDVALYRLSNGELDPVRDFPDSCAHLADSPTPGNDLEPEPCIECGRYFADD